MEFSSFEAFAKHLDKVADKLEEEVRVALHDIGERALHVAQNKIGEYQPEYNTPKGFNFPEWEPLHEPTLYGGVSPSGHRYPGKIALGYASEGDDKPLLREGDMGNSITFSLSKTWDGQHVTLGSDSQTMVFQELGTVEISPRFVIGSAMAETVQEYGLIRLRVSIERAFA